MFLLTIAVLLTVLKLLALGPFANLGWMWIIGVYALTGAWWAWADRSGYTKRKAQERMDTKKQARIERQRDQLGLAPKKKR
jgi:small Trp-rich protein